MRFFTSAVKLALLAPLVSAASLPTRADESLLDWFSSAPWKFFPNHTDWEAGYDEVFSRDVKATFNFQTHDFESLKTFFAGVYSKVSAGYSEFYIDPVDTVVLPAAQGLGGNVYMTGRETGVSKADGKSRTERDAAFGVVGEEDGVRKFTEWRETTNFF